MKHTLILLVGLLYCNMEAFAQSSFMIDPSNTLKSTIAYPGLREKYVIYFYNRTEGDLKLTWQVLSLDSPTGWDLTICDKTSCHNLGPTAQGTMTAMEKDGNDFLAITPVCHRIPGTATIEIAIWDQAKPDEKQVLTWIIEYSEQAGVTGITAPANDILLYPNPATEEIKLSIPIMGGISIMDMKGATIISKELPGGNTIDVSTLAPGEYVLSFPAEDVIRYLKFIKQ